MGKRLDCPMEGCHAHIEGDSEEDILDQAASHAEEAHPDLVLDEATVADLRSQIQDA